MAAGYVRLPLISILLALTPLLSAMAQSRRAAPTPPSPAAVDIRDIHSRQQPGYLPGKMGMRVVVEGVVTTRAINFGEYAHLPIQDLNGTGLLLERERGALEAYTPGNVVKVIGTVAHRTGVPVLAIEKITVTGQAPVPEPVHVRVFDLTKFRNVGKYVVVDTFVITSGQNSGGDVLVVGGPSGASVSVFYPRFKRWDGVGLHAFDTGSKVRITGIASQYCPVEPFDRGFQLVIDDPSQIVLLDRGWMIPLDVVLYLVVALVLASIVWWFRERRMAGQRKAINSMMSLSEKVLSSNSVGEIARKVEAVLPKLLKAQNVDLFLFSKVRNTLDRIPNDLAQDPLSVDIDDPKGAYASAVSLCYRNRTLLNVPDFRKNPLVERGAEQNLPAAAVFVPMFAQGEILGVVAVTFRTRSQPNRSQQTALQHVANQIAASLRLQEQQSIREQLLRTEKMAAAGQLISGVAHDLRAPLVTIRDAAMELRSRRGDASDRLIASEAERGLQIVNHLLSFARMERTEARAVNLHEVVSSVMETREPEWRRKGIRLDNALPVSPVEVFADESELEQIVLSILIHVEHAVQANPGQGVRVASRVLGSRIQISFDFAGPSDMQQMVEEATAGDSFGLRVCQAIAQSHGGDLRLFQTHQSTFRYELEMPVHLVTVPHEAVPEPVRSPSRVLTVILVDQDAAVQRKMLAWMGVRGHRAIPVDNAEEAAELVQRMSFDVVFCSNRLPGLSWTEFFRRIRRRVGAFVLLSDQYDDPASSTLLDDGGFVLSKPVEEDDLQRVLTEVESRSGVRAR